MRGVTSNVEIVFRRGNTIVQTTRVTAATTTMNNLLVYSDFYTISELSTSDNDTEFKCRLVIRASPNVRADTAVTLDVTGEYFPKSKCCWMTPKVVIFVLTYVANFCIYV